jgi:tetratricopeptide (TPR) repeat protein
LFQYNIVRADLAAAHEIASALFQHAEHHPDRPIVDAYLANGMVAFVLGEFDEAKALFEKGLELSSPETDAPRFSTHGQNPGLFCLSYLAHTLCFLGDFAGAKAAIERSLSIAEARAREPAHIYGYVNALTFAVRVYQFCDDVAEERRLAEKVLEIARRNHYTYYEALSRCHLGWVTGAEGHLSEGIDEMVASIAALEQADAVLTLPGFCIRLSELCIRADRLPEAERALERAVSPRGLSRWDAEIERLWGDILAAQGHFAAAESAYRSGLAIATRQNARFLMLKAGLALSQLLRRVDRPWEAREVLELCLADLPSGMDTQEVQSARAAIADLSLDD